MQLTSLLVAATTLLAGTAKAYTSDTFILRATPETPLTSPYNQVSYANSSAYIGNIKYQTFAEPLILTYPLSGVGRLSFTSYHSSPTGWQNIYIYPNATRPVGFTIPHSGFLPPDATANDFTVGDDQVFRYKDTNAWYACPVAGFDGTYNLFYAGGADSPADCTAVTLKAEPYGVPKCE